MDDQPINSPPQEIPVQDLQLKSNHNWLKTLTIGFTIVSFCTAIGIIGYFWTLAKNKPINQNQSITIISPSPTPDPTSNWKTYTNNKYNYSIKYPVDSYKLFNTTTDTFISVNDTGMENSFQDVLPFEIKVFPMDNTMLSINNDLFVRLGGYSMDFLNGITPQSYVLDGVNGYVIYGINAGVSGIERQIIVIKNNFVYDIQSNNSYARDEVRYKKLFDQILSTFKFTQ